MSRHEERGIHLASDLQGVAPVDKDGRLFTDDRRKACGAGKAGQPGQALGPRRHVFTLVLVTARDDKAVPASTGEFATQVRQAFWIAGHSHSPQVDWIGPATH